MNLGKNKGRYRNNIDDKINLTQIFIEAQFGVNNYSFLGNIAIRKKVCEKRIIDKLDG